MVLLFLVDTLIHSTNLLSEITYKVFPRTIQHAGKEPQHICSVLQKVLIPISWSSLLQSSATDVMLTV